jgi:hypothetical protein
VSPKARRINAAIDAKAMTTIHVYPLEDSKPHDLEHGDLCPCHPELERFANGSVMVTHNAWDGRHDEDEGQDEDSSSLAM